jgi:hypothetical protein
MREAHGTSAWWRRVRRDVAHRSPIMLRRTHVAELSALARAADDLCTAIQRAAGASLLATRRWQALAERYRRERDEANQEIARLQATVASLVVGSATDSDGA